MDHDPHAGQGGRFEVRDGVRVRVEEPTAAALRVAEPAAEPGPVPTRRIAVGDAVRGTDTPGA